MKPMSGSGASLSVVSSGDAICQGRTSLSDDQRTQLCDHGDNGRNICIPGTVLSGDEALLLIQSGIFLLLFCGSEKLLPDRPFSGSIGCFL